jgi:hypothetical protein
MEKTTDADKNIDLLMQFADVIFFPAGLTFSFNLARQILKKNIPILQGVIRSLPNETIPVTGFNHFTELCQKHEIEGTVKFTSEQFDMLTKTFVAFMSGSRKAV